MKTPEEIREASDLLDVVISNLPADQSSYVMGVVMARGVLGWIQGDPEYARIFQEIVDKIKARTKAIRKAQEN